jgi:hypothetical protein
MRAELGIDVSWPQELNGAQRQRHQLDAGVTIERVYASSVRETSDTYPAQVTV